MPNPSSSIHTAPTPSPAPSGRVPPSVVIKPAVPGFVIDVENLPIIDTVIPLEGPLANVGGTFPASVQALIRMPLDRRDPEFVRAEVALVWGPNSSMRIASDARTQAMCRFAVEMLVAPGQVVGDADRLICSQSTPFSIGLEAGSRPGMLTLVGNVHVHHSPQANAELGWVSVRAPDALPVDAWTRVGLIWDGDCASLVVAGKVVARRVFRNAELATLPQVDSTDFFIGTWVDGRRNRYVGKLAGVRIWNTLPSKWIAALAEAENVGLGAIESRHEDLGGAGGMLGAALGPASSGGEGRWQSFAKGMIVWSHEGGARAILAPLHELYAVPRVRSGLGFPIVDEARVGEARVQLFERGAMFSSKVASRSALWGSIYRCYLTHAQLLGLPTSAVPVGSQANPDLAMQFERGRIYASPQTGAFEVHGLIHEHYLSASASAGRLGLPISDEEAVRSASGSEIGRVSEFEGGAIYYSVNTGAHELHGPILHTYRMLGGPAGELGFPVTGELAAANGIRYAGFEQGVIVWRAAWASAKALRNYQVRFERAYQSSAIDDGADAGAELFARVTLHANGIKIVERERVPDSGHSGASVEIDRAWDVPIRHDTVLSLKIETWDHDDWSGDDYQGRIEQRYDVNTLWGTLSADAALDGEVGIWADQPCTNKGDASPNLGTIRFSYAIRGEAQRVEPLRFREQGYWRFRNEGTPELGKDLYVQAFRDVDMVSGWLDTLLNPLDEAFYHAVFKGAAKGGNCFGMAAEALRSLKGVSLFPQHLSRFTREQTIRHINIMQGSQYSAEMFYWVLESFFNLDLFQPTDTFDTIRQEIDRHGACIVSLVTHEVVGHSLLAYRYEGGTAQRYGRIYVADPNLPFSASAPDERSYIDVFRNDTFDSTIAIKGTACSSANATFACTPYRVISSTPRTPIWEIVMAVMAGVLLVFGDASPEQARVGGRALRSEGAARRIVAGHPLVPLPRFDGGADTSVLLARTRVKELLELELVGRKTGRYQQLCMLGPAGYRIDNPIEAGALDRVRVEDASSPYPMVSLEVAGATKLAKLDYFVARDPSQRPARSFSLELQQAKDDIARVGIDPRGAALVISPGGAPRPFDLTITVDEAGKQRRGVLRGLVPTSGNEALRLVPDDWSNPLGSFAVERLSSLAGGVLERKLVRGS